MKNIIFILLIISSIAKADMAGVRLGVAQKSKPYLTVNYQFVKDLPYLDLSLSFNSDYVQPSISVGFQFEHINMGIVGSINSGLWFGTELGYNTNLSELIYIMHSGNILFSSQSPVLGTSLGFGFNL